MAFVLPLLVLLEWWLLFELDLSICPLPLPSKSLIALDNWFLCAVKSNRSGGLTAVGVCCGVSRLISLSLDRLDESCCFGGDVKNVDDCSDAIDRSNGVDGDTSPNEMGPLSIRGLFWSDEQTGLSSIGGEYVVMVSGNVMPGKAENVFNEWKKNSMSINN